MSISLAANGVTLACDGSEAEIQMGTASARPFAASRPAGRERGGRRGGTAAACAPPDAGVASPRRRRAAPII